MILDYKLWWTESKLYLFFLLGIVLWGLFGLNKNSCHNWEEASITLTLILTILIYAQGFWGPKKFQSVDFSKVGLFVIALLAVLITIGFLMADTIHQYFPNLVNIELPRWGIMALILFTSLLLSWMDYQIGKEDDIFMMKLFYYSDLPIIVTLIILLTYSIFNRNNHVVDPFFSGAIAFQMSISIFLASVLKHENILRIKSIFNTNFNINNN